MPLGCRIRPSIFQVSLEMCWYLFTLLGGEKHCKGNCLVQVYSTLTHQGLDYRLSVPCISHLTMLYVYAGISMNKC